MNVICIFCKRSVKEGCKDKKYELTVFNSITSKTTFNSGTKGACKLVSGTFGSTEGHFCMDCVNDFEFIHDFGFLEEFVMTDTPHLLQLEKEVKEGK